MLINEQDTLVYQQSSLTDYFVTSLHCKRQHTLSDKYFYWGHCETCAGLSKSSRI